MNDGHNNGADLFVASISVSMIAIALIVWIADYSTLVPLFRAAPIGIFIFGISIIYYAKKYLWK